VIGLILHLVAKTMMMAKKIDFWKVMIERNLSFVQILISKKVEIQ
jgi:hypothetical protein